MLRIYFLQHWFNLSDPGAEEALYESRSMCRFAGIDLGREPVPDESTILNFRHLLERHAVGEPVSQAVGEYLQEQGLRIASGTIVDASIISAPSSTKNKDKARDPEMHQTKEGNQWYFGMKAHVGVDSKTRQIHSVAATAANVHDSQVLEDLLHGDETRVWDDSAYTGQSDVIRRAAPCAQDFTHEKGCRHQPLADAAKTRNRTKSKVRAKVEYVFGVIKRVFGFTKVRYRGLAKNAHALFVLCALTNLYMARRRLRCLV
jgi:IS5 family transposase